MEIDGLIDSLIEREGGYVDHPADRGGATRWGITEPVARAQGYDGPMRALPRGAAAAIYRTLYWEAPHLDRVSNRAAVVATEMFDTGVNMGPAIAVTFLQRALNALNRGARDYPDVRVDGEIGPRTLTALDGFLRTRGGGAQKVLVKAIEALRGARYLELAERRPANEAFVYGWITNRIG